MLGVDLKRQPAHAAVGLATMMLGWLLTIPAALACPFCSSMGKSLAESVDEAGLVVYGRLSNAKPAGDATQLDGTTQMSIRRIIKDHPILKAKKEVLLARYVPTVQQQEDFVVFAEVIDGRIDPYRGMPVETTEIVDYLEGAVAVAKSEPARRLGHFFRYLDHGDATISSDAYKEFANAPYEDVAAAAKQFDANRLIAWIRDRDTPSYRMGLYGCLLGACGKPEHAAVLKGIIDDPKTRPMTGIDGLLGGYCVLDPKSGPDYALDLLTNRTNSFNLRYAALRTVRFLLMQPGFDRDHIFQRMAKAIEAPDIADLVIDEFRKSQRWEPVGTVISLYGQKEFDLQVVRRAIIRFALRCPGEQAANFIEGLKKKDPQLVRDVEEILRFEESQQIQLSSGQ